MRQTEICQAVRVQPSQAEKNRAAQAAKASIHYTAPRETPLRRDPKTRAQRMTIRKDTGDTGVTEVLTLRLVRGRPYGLIGEHF